MVVTERYSSGGSGPAEHAVAARDDHPVAHPPEPHRLPHVGEPDAAAVDDRGRCGRRHAVAVVPADPPVTHAGTVGRAPRTGCGGARRARCPRRSGCRARRPTCRRGSSRFALGHSTRSSRYCACWPMSRHRLQLERLARGQRAHREHPDGVEAVEVRDARARGPSPTSAARPSRRASRPPSPASAAPTLSPPCSGRGGVVGVVGAVGVVQRDPERAALALGERPQRLGRAPLPLRATWCRR